MLNDRSQSLVLVIALSAGFAAVLGVMRFVWGWRLRSLILACLIPCLGMTVCAHFHPELKKLIGLAWDCGGAVAGPVTVPLVLALGIGVASAIGQGTSSLSGFGIVTLASLFPVMGVLIYGAYLVWHLSPDEVMAASRAAMQATAAIGPSWVDRTPWTEVISAARAILPLIAFLGLVLKGVMRGKVPHRGIIAYGLFLSLAGMALFNVGLTYGLGKLGDQSGASMSGAFARIDSIRESPLFAYGIGVTIAAVFAWTLGFGATLAEPAVNALAGTVEDLTNGAFRGRTLRIALSLGVAVGISLGVLKIIFDFPLEYILIPGYLGAWALTVFSTDEMVNVGWDAAGVTTGPVTVPLVLTLGLGLGNAVHAVEGFGILALATLCSVFPVLAVGLWVEMKTKTERV